ncbi:hypothetical protein QR77_33320 [Streptomyces sp. 150FB]|uniref:TIGR03086 family metal-binding protein n=1 Tax=Streptomyces sp. 150FB TaxID=1576605 RepID=UPI000589517B|nr:TIGR03086 family metal-binding protein [Streptomyces sp. 150FB]KIF77418.1 hypothetical protein QR77_33320 [Streptomyces sp. 150FB]
MNHLYSVMEECAAESARIARNAPAELTGATPCAAWDAKTLVNHWVVYTSHGLEHRALRTTLPDDLVKHDFTADADWAERYAAQLERAVAAWGDPAVWEGEIGVVGSATPAPDVAAMLIAELALHGWDVARTTGQEFRISEESGTAVLRIVEEQAEMFRQYEGFAAAVEPPEPASAFARALALSGRTPHSPA